MVSAPVICPSSFASVSVNLCHLAAARRLSAAAARRRPVNRLRPSNLHHVKPPLREPHYCWTACSTSRGNCWLARRIR